MLQACFISDLSLGPSIKDVRSQDILRARWKGVLQMWTMDIHTLWCKNFEFFKINVCPHGQWSWAVVDILWSRREREI